MPLLSAPWLADFLRDSTPLETVKRIQYRPLEREAERRRDDLKRLAFKIVGKYEDYGSTDGEWRNVPMDGKKRIVLPLGCAPRRSRRLLNIVGNDQDNRSTNRNEKVVPVPVKKHGKRHVTLPQLRVERRSKFLRKMNA